MKYVINDNTEATTNLSYVTLDELEVTGANQKRLNIKNSNIRGFLCSSKYAKINIKDCDFKNVLFDKTMIEPSFFSNSTFERLVFNAENNILNITFDDVSVQFMAFCGIDKMGITGLKFNNTKIKHIIFDDVNVWLWKFSDCHIEIFEIKGKKPVFFDFQNTNIDMLILDGKIIKGETADIINAISRNNL